MSAHESLRLRPRLVPSPLWGVSAYKLLKRSDWERIRRGVLAEAENTCSVCGVARESRMRCDEDWEYDEATGIALLARLRILCPDCSLGRSWAVVAFFAVAFFAVAFFAVTVHLPALK